MLTCVACKCVGLQLKHDENEKCYSRHNLQTMNPLNLKIKLPGLLRQTDLEFIYWVLGMN